MDNDDLKFYFHMDISVLDLRVHTFPKHRRSFYVCCLALGEIFGTCGCHFYVHAYASITQLMLYVVFSDQMIDIWTGYDYVLAMTKLIIRPYFYTCVHPVESHVLSVASM